MPSTASARKDLGAKIRKVGDSAQEAVKEGNALERVTARARARTPEKPEPTTHSVDDQIHRTQASSGPRTAAEELPCEGPAPGLFLGLSCGPTSTRCFRPHVDRGTDSCGSFSSMGPDITTCLRDAREFTRTARDQAGRHDGGLAPGAGAVENGKYSFGRELADPRCILRNHG